MSRIGALLLVAFAVFPCRPAAADAAADKRLNFIIIMTDDQGWGDLACYGHPLVRTPVLDDMARRGVLFTSYYVNGSVCSPTRAAMLTGRWPGRFGIHGALRAETQLNVDRGIPEALDPDVTTIYDVFRAAGWVTAHFGKWHLGIGEDCPSPGEYGIEVHRTINTSGPGWEGHLRGPHRGTATRRIIDESIAFIQSAGDRPFLMNIWLTDPHAPLRPTEEQMRPYRHLAEGSRTYYATLTHIDTEVGRLREALEAAKLSDRTVIVYTSDNGPEDSLSGNASAHPVGSPGPFRGLKRSLYEGGIRVPFIAYVPGATPKSRVDNETIISGMDLFPSFCAMASVPIPADLELDGEDLSQALRGEPQQRRRPLFWEWRYDIGGHIINRSPTLAMREGRWKLLMNLGGVRIELYDLSADPSEMKNVADANPEIIERMRGPLQEWRNLLTPGPMDPRAGSTFYPWPE